MALSVLLARRFVAAVIESAGLLGRRPLIGHRRLELLPDPFRFYTVKGFSYLIVYNSERPTLRVLRVLHMARDLAPLLAEFWDEPADDTPPVIGPQSER